MARSTLERQLLHEPVKALNLEDYCTVTKGTAVRKTVELMRTKRQNCAFVIGAGSGIEGIVTDRDILKKVVNDPETWDQPVESIMTAMPNTVSPEATTQEALALMDRHHHRNVPVVLEDGLVIGNVTHFSVLKYLTDHFPEDVYNLPPDPENYATDRAGG